MFRKVGDVFSGGFKVAEVYSDGGATGCWALLATIVVVILLFAAALGWLLDHPVALLGVLFYCVGSFFAVRTLLVAMKTDSSEGLLGPGLAGLVVGGLGLLLMFASPMHYGFIIALVVIYTANVLPS